MGHIHGRGCCGGVRGGERLDGTPLSHPSGFMFLEASTSQDVVSHAASKRSYPSPLP